MSAVASETSTAGVSEQTVWGLSASEIHAAFWVSCGVACVELGRKATIQRGADVFLLLEPSRAVYFDLRAVSETLLWSGANLTRIRVFTGDRERYREQVRIGLDGGVLKVERQYHPGAMATAPFFLTADPKLARAWSDAPTVGEAMVALRRAARIRTDLLEVDGGRFDLDDPAEREAFLTRLVREWPHPDRVIEGIRRVSEGVFVGCSGAPVAVAPRVPPIWIGAVPSDAPSLPTIVGPAFVADGVRSARAKVRSIDDIFFSQASSSSALPVTAVGASMYLPFKRVIDCVASLLALVLLLPVMLACAAAIVVDDGFPIFFGHCRQAKGGRNFRCLKFRTMRRNAEAKVAELRKQNLCDGPQVFIRDDPRVTRVGRWLRTLQLDELPQLWNVVIGDMSLVGPRPSPDGENQFCPAWREKRLSVRPGITGLWQVMRTRRPGMDFQEWIRYDIDYVERLGPTTDLKICVLTILNALRRLKSGG